MFPRKHTSPEDFKQNNAAKERDNVRIPPRAARSRTVALECLVEWVSAGTSRYVLGCIKGSSREDSVAFQGWTGHLLIGGKS